MTTFSLEQGAYVSSERRGLYKAPFTTANFCGISHAHDRLWLLPSRTLLHLTDSATRRENVPLPG